MQNLAFQELIDREQLQLLQDEFSKATGVALCCVDADGNLLTEVSEQRMAPEDWYSTDAARLALDRVQDGSLEDMAIEEYPQQYARIAAVAIRVEQETALYWLVYCDETTDSVQLAQVLDLLRDAGVSYCGLKMSRFSAEAESKRSRYAEQEMSRSLHTIEAMTGIVQLLDSDEQIERILEQWLGIFAGHLQAETAEIFQLAPGGETMDLLSEWRSFGLLSSFDHTRSIASYGMLRTDKPLVLSGESIPEEYTAEMKQLGLTAVMVFPVLMSDNGANMVVSVEYRTGSHTWTMSEIKFTSDTVKILQNLLTKRIQKNSLAGSFAALEAILENVGCAIYVTDRQTQKLLFANRRLRNTFSRELENGNFDELLHHQTEEKNTGSYELYYAEREHWYEVVRKEISWVDGKRALLYSFYDITDRKLYQRRIEQQAYTDFLTGLYNRLCCERDLARRIDEAQEMGTRGAILYMDLDDFKHINDGLGHQYGDVLLKSISHSLRRIRGIEDTCYRMGGDEFVIMIPPSAYEETDRIIEDIREIFSKPWFLKDADYYCTMSMGIATFPDAGTTVADLVKKADIAMYEAKKGGKNRIARYSEDIGSESGKRLDMEKNMREATAEGCQEFVIYYQPIVDVTGKEPECAGAEALIRWNSARQGFISPGEFIPLAEYLGLINPIGNYVLVEACKRCHYWNEHGKPHFKVNVNLSVVQLLQNNIVEQVEKAIEETGIDPHNLTLEVTESLAINDMERMKGILNRIKALDVKIALDDFGTGYSSLNHIREIPFDVIKVDQSFVRDLAEDAYSQSFVKLVAGLAQVIGVDICVEGIETPEQYRVLHDMEIRYIQGYYFDKPMKQEDFEEKYVYDKGEKTK